MLVSQLTGPRTSALVDARDPEPRPGEVVVRVDASGICASELSDWITGPMGPPRRLGHEAVGTIRRVGEGISRWQEGALVTGLMSPAYAEYVTTNADHLLPVPAGVAPEHALGEPIACLVNAMRRTRLELGDKVAIVGLGYMGLGMLQLVALRGPSRLLAIDVRREALDLAWSLGADSAVLPDALDPADLGGDTDAARGSDVVFEASGTQAGLDLAGRLVRQHGILSIVGYHQGATRTVDMQSWNFKAIDVVNAHVRRDADRMAAMAAGLDLIESGKLDFGRLVTHRYPLSDIDRAFADLERKPVGFVKAVILPHG
jgi:threonine dehydrogenase-like Zn-dependent dehydrogenase